jgi:hypothetical protein
MKGRLSGIGFLCWKIYNDWIILHLKNWEIYNEIFEFIVDSIELGIVIILLSKLAHAFSKINPFDVSNWNLFINCLNLRETSSFQKGLKEKNLLFFECTTFFNDDFNNFNLLIVSHLKEAIKKNWRLSQ